MKQTGLDHALAASSCRRGFNGWRWAAPAALLCAACGASTTQPRAEDDTREAPEPNSEDSQTTASDALEDSDVLSADPGPTSEEEPASTPSAEEPPVNTAVERCVAVTPPVPEVPPVSDPPSDADWHNAIVARASDFVTVGGPWQLLRLDTMRVLAKNAAGEFALLYLADRALRDSSVEFGTAAQVCFIDQATAQGLEVRDVTFGSALVCKDQRCTVMRLSSGGLLSVEVNPIEIEDEGWRQLFVDNLAGMSLASDSEVVHFSNAENELPRTTTRVPIASYLPSVAEACAGYTTPYLHSTVWADSTSLTVFGVNGAGSFLYAPFPEGGPDQAYAAEPRCSPLPANLNVIDGQRDAFTEGAHILHSFFLFLTEDEVRGLVYRQISR